MLEAKRNRTMNGGRAERAAGQSISIDSPQTQPVTKGADVSFSSDSLYNSVLTKAALQDQSDQSAAAQEVTCCGDLQWEVIK